jgi:predicted nicotinamide N-methyase
MRTQQAGAESGRRADKPDPLRRRIAGRHLLSDRTVAIGGRSWRLSAVEDQDALMESVQTDADLEQFPYGLLLWESAIGMAERLAEEPELAAGKRVLELGAGVGLPGLVAHALGAAGVTQTDYQSETLDLARINAAQNGIGNGAIRYLLADWRDFGRQEATAAAAAAARYDLILGSDVLYERTLHGALARILTNFLAPGGSVLLSDPLRPQAIEFADQMERSGEWSLTLESRLVAAAARDRANGAPAAREIALFFARRAAAAAPPKNSGKSWELRGAAPGQ